MADAICLDNLLYLSLQAMQSLSGGGHDTDVCGEISHARGKSQSLWPPKRDRRKRWPWKSRWES